MILFCRICTYVFQAVFSINVICHSTSDAAMGQS